jgi:hypothetical protein
MVIALGFENSAGSLRGSSSRGWSFHAHRRENDRALLRAGGERNEQEGVILHVSRAIVLRSS